MNYKSTELVEVKQVHTCLKCGKRFIFTDESLEEIQSALEKHTKQCDCNHQWSAWATSNLGTWPDYEPYTRRDCIKCGKTDVM